LLVLTNAYLYSEPLPPIVYQSLVADMVDDGAPEMQMTFISADSDSAGAIQHPKVRSEFPETWIWLNTETKSSNGQVVYSAKVPDTITSWITSAFAVSDDTGLGVAPETAIINVFRPFFIQLNLPYSVKRNEQMALQVLVFNYESSPQTVRLTLDHDSSSGFKFVNRNGSVVDLRSAGSDYNKRQATVPGNGGSVSVFFPIVPTELGDLKLKVTAIGSTTSDALEKPLLVEPEGFRVDQNRPIVIDLTDQSTYTENVQLIVPPEVVPDSKRAEVNVAGDIMGSVLSNLEGLVKMPYGCGEQNMVNFVPNIVVVNYLNATQRSEPQLVNKAIQFMQRGQPVGRGERG
jgi:CD109 antigen